MSNLPGVSDGGGGGGGKSKRQSGSDAMITLYCPLPQEKGKALHFNEAYCPPH